ncbi:MAG: hypothetical protein JSV21_00855 [Nitrospirota bacterium]|nr:MAG: hypothetical protein JSV21_00855 [Nitrospirota bacterium]
MQVGFNTNIPYKGKVYHVQTEDTPETFSLISLLYFKGAILASRKTIYEHLKDEPDYKEKVRELMKEQHKNLIKELINGKVTEGEQTAEPVVEMKKVEKQDDSKKYKSLDDILIDYIIDKAGDK